MPRPPKPTPPPTAELQAALDALRALVGQDREARRWPHNTAAGSLMEALWRYEDALQSRPDHPAHEAWKARREAMGRPGGASAH